MFNPYVKAVLAALVAFFGALATSFDDSVLTTTEIIAAAGVGLTALGVVWAAHQTVKWLWAGVLAGLGAVGIALQDNAFSYQEGITAVLAVLTALVAVYQTENTKASNAPS